MIAPEAGARMDVSDERYCPQQPTTVSESRAGTEKARVDAFDALVEEQDNIELITVLKTAFDLSREEFRTYLAVLDRPESTTSELANDLDRGSSTINKRLTTLCESGLVSRSRELMSTGGHKYIYQPKPLGVISDRIAQEVDDWSEIVLEQIDRLHTDTETNSDHS